MTSHKPLTAGELEIDCGAFGKIRRASPPVKGDFAVQDGRLTLLGCIQRGLVTLSREELLPFLDAMDAQDAQIRTLNERIIELDLEAMEKCRRIDSLLTPPPDAAVPGSEELAEALAEISAAGFGGVAEGMRLHISDLTRRLAEVEAERDGWREQAKYCAVKREAAEARVRELEAKDEEREAGWQLAGDAARGLRVECDGDLGHEAEQIRAERDALRERCEKLEWLVEVQEFVVYFDPTSTLDNACVELAASWKYAELCAALATEVKPSNYEWETATEVKHG